MAGRLAAAQIIVVEGRKIVVNQRVCVQHLQGAAQFFHSRWQPTSRRNTLHHARRFHAENRTQPFATGKNAVAHGFVN